jgi:hypothetical protein
MLNPYVDGRSGFGGTGTGPAPFPAPLAYVGEQSSAPAASAFSALALGPRTSIRICRCGPRPTAAHLSSVGDCDREQICYLIDAKADPYVFRVALSRMRIDLEGHLAHHAG